MKTRHNKKWVVDHLVKDSKERGINGYIPYDGKYFFMDGSGFMAFLNKDYGFTKSEKLLPTDRLAKVINDLRPNKHDNVAMYSNEYEFVTIKYENLLKMYDTLMNQHRTLGWNTSIKLGDAYYDVRYILWACELMNNRWNKNGEFELFYMKGNKLGAAWFFDHDEIDGDQAICILPVLHR